MNLMKKCIACLLTLVTLISSAPFAVAEVMTFSDSESFSDSAMEEYANSMIVNYLQASNLLDTSKSYALSQGISVHGNSDTGTHIFFVFSDESNVAHLTVTYVDGAYYSSFVATSITEISSAYLNKFPIALYSYENSCYLLCNGSIERISGSDEYVTIPVQTGNVTSTVLTLQQIDLPFVISRGSTLEELLDVDIVNNVKNPDGWKLDSGEDEWICWAACVASVGGYKIGDHNETATGVYNWAKSNLSVSGYSHPVGVPEYIQGSLNRKYNLSYYWFHHGISADTVWNSILNKNPIIIDIHNAKGTLGHSVVITGIVYSSNPIYKIMDPNLTSYTYISVPDTATTNIVYVTSSATYTRWTNSYYR